jgi:hypothetical protein
MKLEGCTRRLMNFAPVFAVFSLVRSLAWPKSCAPVKMK